MPPAAVTTVVMAAIPHRLAAMGCILLIGLAAAFAAAQPAHELRETVTDTSVATVGVEAGLGSVRLVGHAGPEIRVEVALMPRSDGVAVEDPARVAAAIEAARLERVAGEGEVRFAVIYPIMVMYGAVEERWRIDAPRSIGVRVQMAVGDLRVEDIRGGVDLTLGIGDIGVDVPGGDIRASLSVGNIMATTAAPDPGRVMLTTNVGRVNMMQAGRAVPARRTAGPGSRLSLSGGGPDWLILSSDVGDVFLEVSERGK